MIIISLSHYKKTSLAYCDSIAKGAVTDRVNDEPLPDFEFGLVRLQKSSPGGNIFFSSFVTLSTLI